ncbi:hypothetical protein FRB96_009351 [Tulasnella sp. 330]|nr:hypothetical protein FRB96_009351 [Tulasnella sp. 330]KAG8884427.1 hypothetical protein FRB98_002399 [Tulasnella sp. 332]KAG8885263.1 hypothetical protein FRB97_001709 [Tulasnella sp. 331]
MALPTSELPQEISARLAQARNMKLSGPVARQVLHEFIYTPSDDGVDENLLILLHGLGDTHKPFANLGRSLKLPQTATLALKAPLQIPYLYEPAFQWYPSFDQLGDLLTSPNPTGAVNALTQTLMHLVSACGWPANRIHIFGFAQGGTVAAETALRWSQLPFPKQSAAVHTPTMGRDPRSVSEPLASVVSISGPLLSYPTTAASSASKCGTPILYFHRSLASAGESRPLAVLKKGFSDVREIKMSGIGGESMPKSRDEWEGVMRFWSEKFYRRIPGADTEGLYEVMSGTG